MVIGNDLEIIEVTVVDDYGNVFTVPLNILNKFLPIEDSIHPYFKFETEEELAEFCFELGV